MTDFKEQIDKTEAKAVTKLVTELREPATEGQAADSGVDAEEICDAIDKTQQALLSLFS